MGIKKWSPGPSLPLDSASLARRLLVFATTSIGPSHGFASTPLGWSSLIWAGFQNDAASLQRGRQQICLGPQPSKKWPITRHHLKKQLRERGVSLVDVLFWANPKLGNAGFPQA